MDDDLLADDGQYKDVQLDDLDVTEEAALLGLSDEELDSRDNEELEYVDEDGNPVEIGENNAELYEFANVKSNKRSRSPVDEDVLELDLDAEIESFTQENPDLIRESPVYDRKHKENLIPLTSRNKDKQQQQRRHSPDERMEPYSSTPSRRSESSYSEPLAFEDESDNESIDDHRERFKSERSNIITLTPASKRDIPDTLESVISVEENAKVQAFLEQEQQRKMRSRGGRGGRNRNPNFNRHQPSYQHQHSQQQQQQQHHHQSNQPQHQPHHQPHHQSNQPQHQPHQNQHQPHQGQPQQNQPHQHPEPQFSSAPPTQTYQSPPGPAPGRKILINPHFRGEVRLPIPASEPAMVTNQPSYDSKPPMANPPYQQNPPYNPPPVYNQDNMMNMAPPVYNAPPPMQYGQPDYHLSGPPQNVVPQNNAWPPQEMGPPPTSYANPPPVMMNYTDPISQPPPNFQHNFNPAYQPPYQNLNVPPPQPVYNPQPQVHVPPPTYNNQPPLMSPMGEHQYQPQQHLPPPQQNIQKPYHDQRNNSHNMPPPNQRNNQMQNQRFQRPTVEKRPSPSAVKHLPPKMPRLENKKVTVQTKKNAHVNNSNIREIPLVDTSVTKSTLVAKATPSKPQGEVENWDEYLKEELEKQRQRREEIFRFKEERRKQNAIRLQEELRKREMEQNPNNISVQRVVQPQKGRNRVPVAPKANVRERIGIPMGKTVGSIKKKVVVVRKKNQNEAAPGTIVQTKLPVRQRVGLKPGQNPVVPPQKKIVRTTPNPPAAAKQAPAKPPVQPPAAQTAPAKPAATPPKAADPPPAATAKKTPPNQQKNKMQQRLGNRPNFHKMNNSPRMHSPRFRPPFMEQPLMRFPPDHPQRFNDRPRMFNDHPRMFNDHPRMFDDHPPRMFGADHRPPLIHDAPPPFMMEGGRFGMFNRGFPRGEGPPFPRMMFDQNRSPFQRQPPRFQKRHERARSGSGQIGGSSGPGGASNAPAVVGAAGNQGPNSNAKGVSESFSVSVEHISSSTNEASLKKMASTVGVVKNVNVEADKKRAVITFAETSHAVAFQKKYQRFENLSLYLRGLTI